MPDTVSRQIEATKNNSFPGFEPPTANFVYCPNQFFDVCLPHCSRGALRLVSYILRQTLGFRDADGNPIRHDVSVSYADFRKAGISRGSVRPAVEEAIEMGFLECVERGTAKAKGSAGVSSRFQLRWGSATAYQTSLARFDGFYTGDGCRSPIPNAFFDAIVPTESLAVVKVVGTVLRHTVGYENQFGRRQQAPLSYSRMQDFAQIKDRSTLSDAIARALAANYIERVGEGIFDNRKESQQAAVYAVKWQEAATNPNIGSKNRPEHQFKNPTRVGSKTRPEKPDRYENPTSNSSESRPDDRFKNQTAIKKEEKDTSKQQAVVADQSVVEFLVQEGMTEATAVQLAATTPAAEIRRQVDWLSFRQPSNRPAMLRRAIEERWSEPEGIAKEAARKRDAERDARRRAELRDREAVSQARSQQRKVWRELMLSHWHGLSLERKRHFTKQALDRVNSHTQRQLILNSSLTDSRSRSVGGAAIGRVDLPSFLIQPMPNSTASPNNPHAERNLLGAILLDPERFVLLGDSVNAADFHDPLLGKVFEAMTQLHEAGKPIDFITVTDRLNDEKAFHSSGGSAFLAELPLEVPTSSNIGAYAEIIANLSLKRKVARFGRRMIELALDPETTTEAVVETAEQGVLNLSRQTPSTTCIDLATLREERYAHYTAVYEAEDKSAFFGLSTGFPDLDRIITGLPSGDLMVVAARPSMGKTAFALDIARHVAERLQQVVMFVSLEMSKEQVADRIMAGALQVSTHELRRGLIEEDDFRRMGQVFDEITPAKMYIDDDCDCTLAHLRSRTRRQQLERGLDLLIVDYLQLIEVGGKVGPENRVQEVSKISRDLKRLARELRVPVIAISQLSRSVENRTDKRPQLSDLRESGSIEQDADTVLMLYRDDYYDEDSAEAGITNIFIRKQRQGPTGRVDVRFNRERMCHESLAREGTGPDDIIAV